MRVETIRGTEADELLAEDEFRLKWSALSEQCPWATAFQTPEFARAWYGTYRGRWEPLLLLCRDADGRLKGLLALAVSTSDGKVVVAGTHQAEYHAWICRPDLGDCFAREVFQTLREQFPSATLTFRYLPPGAPVGWLADPGAKRMCLLKAQSRPLLLFSDGTKIAKSLKKGGNKSRLRRLAKNGPVQLKRVTTPSELEAVFDTVIRCYDARRLAVNGSAPFQNDPLKKPFHLAMMQARGLLHVTVLMAGDQVASTHVNVCGKKQVHLGLIAHNPLLARQSPGKLHILMLADLLLREGYEQLDMTPGGESYKDRFANDSDRAYTLTLFPTPGARRKAVAYRGVDGVARKILNACGIAPAKAKSAVDKLRRLDPAAVPPALVSFARRRLWSRRETRVYVHPRADAPADAPADDVPSGFRRDAIEDLLAYRPLRGAASRREFLSASLARIEAGQHVYTYSDGVHLLHFAWLVERPAEEVRNDSPPDSLPDSPRDWPREFPLSPGGAVITHLYTFPEARGRGLATLCLRTMMRDAARDARTRATYVAVPAGNAAARRVVEKVGFTYEGSVFEQTKIGWSQRRVILAAQPPRGG